MVSLGVQNSVYGVLSALLFLVWIVQLAGISSLQQQCNSGNSQFNSLLGGGLGAGGAGTLGATFYTTCGELLRWDWWITFLQFITVMLVLGAAGGKKAHAARSALTGMLALSTAWTMWQANQWYQATKLTSGLVFTRAQVASAGYIMTSIVGILLLLTLGLHMDDKAAV